MTVEIFKSRAREGYTYREIYSTVIKEFGLTAFPFKEAHNIIRNFLVKQNYLNRVEIEGHIRYVAPETRFLTKPINLGTDVSTGYNVYALPEERRFVNIDENWNVSSPKYLRLTVSTTFSLDTHGDGSHQRLKFYEATAFRTLNYTEDIVSFGEDLRDFIREAISHYFNAGCAEASEIKIGVELISNPEEEAFQNTVYIEYGHTDSKSGGYRVLKKTESDMAGDKNPHAGLGRKPSQKTLS